MLLLHPDGSGLGMELGWLEHSPFENYLIPGTILLLCNGLFPMFTFVGLLLKPDRMWANIFNMYKNRHWAWTYSLYSGIIVIFWISIQLLLTQYFWLQPVMIIIGLMIIIFTMIPSVMKQYEIH